MREDQEDLRWRIQDGGVCVWVGRANSFRQPLGLQRRVQKTGGTVMAGVVKKGRTGVMDPFRQHLGLQQRVQTTGGTVMETVGDEDGKKGRNEPVPPTASFPTEGAEDR